MATINYYEKFDSIEQMLSIMATRNVNKPWERSEPSQDNNYDQRGTHSWGEACDLAVNGDEKSWKLLSKDFAAVQANKIGDSYKAKLEYAVCGGCVDVPRYLSGNPMCMAQRVRNKKTTKVINLVYNEVIAWSEDKKYLSKVGAKVLRAVQLIEQAGVKVNIYVGMIGRVGDEAAGCIVNIKPSNVGVSAYSTAFAMVNPSMLRRVMFRWFETYPQLPQYWEESYGTCAFEDMYQDRNLGKYAYISCRNDGNKSVQELIDCIIEQVSKR